MEWSDVLPYLREFDVAGIHGAKAYLTSLETDRLVDDINALYKYASLKQAKPNGSDKLRLKHALSQWRDQSSSDALLQVFEIVENILILVDEDPSGFDPLTREGVEHCLAAADRRDRILERAKNCRNARPHLRGTD